MADTIPPGYAQMIIPFKHVNMARQALISFGVELNDVPTVGSVNAIWGAFQGTWGAAIDTNVTIRPGELRVGQDGGDALVITGNVQANGTADRGDSINPQAAILVHKRTSRGGRRGRGRFYVPWALDDGGVDETGNLISAALAALQTRADNFLTALVGLAIVDNMVLLHSDGISAKGAPNAVTSLSVDGIIGTQRRRLGR